MKPLIIRHFLCLFWPRNPSSILFIFRSLLWRKSAARTTRWFWTNAVVITRISWRLSKGPRFVKNATALWRFPAKSFVILHVFVPVQIMWAKMMMGYTYRTGEKRILKRVSMNLPGHGGTGPQRQWQYLSFIRRRGSICVSHCHCWCGYIFRHVCSFIIVRCDGIDRFSQLILHVDRNLF